MARGKVTLNPVTNVRRLEGALRRRIKSATAPKAPTGHRGRGIEVHRRAEDDMRNRAEVYRRSQEKSGPGNMRFDPKARLDTSQVQDRRKGGDGLGARPTPGTTPQSQRKPGPIGAVSRGALERRVRKGKRG